METSLKSILSAIVVSVLLILVSCHNQKDLSTSINEPQNRNFYRFMFYNVENLFDTIDAPKKKDEDFTPDGRYHWTSFRYYKKIQMVSKVIIAVGQWEAPDFIGLCEIENRSVLEDLLRLTPLKKYNYDIIHKESPDFRGIDNALLYRRDKARVLFYDFYPVQFPDNPGKHTRDIIYARFVLKNKENDTLNVFINHFPSRWGGQEASEPGRLLVAGILRSKVDSLLSLNSNANILICGDFNDEPSNKSISEVLKARGDSSSTSDLYNLMAQYEKKGQGSYRYQYEWNMLDQIIVSKSLLDGQGLETSFAKAKIFRADWLMYEDKKYNSIKPNRTFVGPRYTGGYSDHLPVFTDLMVQ